MILGGDLNLTLNASESWGTKAVLDPLASHFRLLFESVDLVNVAPPDASPTWRNGRVGDEGISKPLDQFLISSSLIPVLNFHCVWAIPANISDHFSIRFEWNKKAGSFNFPFKFNRS